MSVFSIFIINKAGGLIYQKDFADIPKKRGNDYLRIASTFHGLHVMAADASPVDKKVNEQFSPLSSLPNGIETVETSSFRLQCLSTLTGIKFFVTAQPQAVELKQLLSEIYVLYTDYVLKNPFYVTEMPIHCVLFDQHLKTLMNEFAAAAAKRARLQSPSSNR